MKTVLVLALKGVCIQESEAWIFAGSLRNTFSGNVLVFTCTLYLSNGKRKKGNLAFNQKRQRKWVMGI